MKENNRQNRERTRRSRTAKRLAWLLILVIVAGGAVAYAYLHARGGNSKRSIIKAGTFTVRRGDLTVSVVENGDIKPLNSLVIKSKVEKRSTTIISIVDEGTYITAEDVNNGKILVELDTSEIKQELMEEEIKFLDGQADMTAAKEAVDIQMKQNESDIEAGRMMVRFSLMDLQKYLGASVAQEVITKAENSTNWQDEVNTFVNDSNLGGEALQMIRELSSKITLTEAQLARAEDELKGTQQLYDSNYVAETELKSDQLDVQSLEIQKEQAETARALYVKYEFPKQVVTLLSGCHEAKRELERIEAGARSKLAQAQAEYDKEEAKYALQVEELKHEREQLEACTIRAPAPGEVVYASSMASRGERRNRPIELGASISERQSIILMPDPSVMKVEVRIHETWIDKIQPGQAAKINVAAFPEETLTGEVLKKAPMADPEEWLNPDLKVYSTDVKINGTHEQLKTGMTAKVEIIIEELKDVISVPIQSVVNVEGRKVCYVASPVGPQQRQVEIGAFNDNFVEIKNGLSEGEEVLLNPPRRVESDAAQG
jgi:multidrug efflux pump subunit AcrA (membrane-fusion protein)